MKKRDKENFPLFSPPIDNLTCSLSTRSEGRSYTVYSQNNEVDTFREKSSYKYPLFFLFVLYIDLYNNKIYYLIICLSKQFFRRNIGDNNNSTKLCYIIIILTN